MNTLITVGCVIGGGLIGAPLGAWIGVALNTTYDDLMFAEGLSALFGGLVGLSGGVAAGAVVASLIA